MGGLACNVSIFCVFSDFVHSLLVRFAIAFAILLDILHLDFWFWAVIVEYLLYIERMGSFACIGVDLQFFLISSIFFMSGLPLHWRFLFDILHVDFWFWAVIFEYLRFIERTWAVSHVYVSIFCVVWFRPFSSCQVFHLHWRFLFDILAFRFLVPSVCLPVSKCTRDSFVNRAT